MANIPDMHSNRAQAECIPAHAECTIFHDGACPLCRREVAFLRGRDSAGRLHFIDIADESFDASAYGLDAGDVMREIHGLDAQRRVLRGPELFRAAYEIVGLGWLWRWTAWPVARPLVNAAYRLFARVRVPIGSRLERFGMFLRRASGNHSPPCTDRACAAVPSPPKRRSRDAKSRIASRR
jgi:predicted DCC family thiol-disulfide oxidoreductase YuxK